MTLLQGLAALLVQGLSGITPKEIITIPPEFITELGLQQSLTPSRNNGFLNMFKLMQSKALEVAMESVNAASQGTPSVDAARDANASVKEEQTGQKNQEEESSTPVGDSIRRKLEQELEPTKLVIQDESSKHANHAERMGAASQGETHFTIEIVSNKFQGLTSIKRHRLVYGILEEELEGSVHALSLVTKTPEEA